VEGGSANDYDYVSGDPINGFDLAGTCEVKETKGLSWRRVRNARCRVTEGLSEVDWGTAFAGQVNVVWGTFKATQGGIALVAGVAAVPFVGPLPAAYITPYGLWQIGTGVSRTTRGVRQLTGDHGCESECTVAGNLKRFGLGVIPGRNLIDFFGGLP